jgi:hypothetical protein
MASSSVTKDPLPLAGKWTDGDLKLCGPNRVLCPVLRLKKTWETQVMFPYSLNDTIYAFGGPQPEENNRNKDTIDIFPIYKPCAPRVYTNEPYNFSFIKKPNQVFRSAPYVTDTYKNWLARVQNDFGGIWQSYGIFDFIQLSKIEVKYNQEMLIAALHFFESSTNTFHFECGMMTPTLFDVAAITGLPPTGDAYDPTRLAHPIDIGFKNKTYAKYTSEHYGEGEVSDEEHIAFLALWLSQHVFCTKSLQVAKCFIIMANQIHEGQQFGLSRLILGCLYESMRSACELMKKTGDGSVFLGYGPFWLLQLWLHATFPTELDVMLPEMHYEQSGGRQIEGTRLSLMVPRPRGWSYDQSFIFYFKAFFNLQEFKSSFAPFLHRTVGPQWFIHPFPPLEECAEEITNIWKAYLTPTLLSCRFGITSKDFGLVGYFPNLVSRQFGLTQILPKSIYSCEREICLGYYGMTEPHFLDFMNKFRGDQYDCVPFKFEFSYATTREFSQWWELQYCGHVVSESLLLEAIRNGFEESILNKIKSKLNKRGKFLPLFITSF